MEILKDASDELISHLSYKNPSTASYIIDRNSASFHAVGGDTYSPVSGVRLIKFNINSEDFLDPNSLRIQFDIVNTGTGKTLFPVGGPHGFFSRCRLLSRGAVIEDISQYNRVHEMLRLFKSTGGVQDDLTESFLNEYNKGGTITKELSGVTDRMTVLFKPIFGLLNQPKYLSLKYTPLTIELELDSNMYANIVEPPDANSVYKDVYTAAMTSGAFNIQNCIVRCDIIKVDSELQNKYDNHFMSEGGFINLRYTTYHSQIMKIVGDTNFNVNISRSLTYLTRIYTSFIKSPIKSNDSEHPADFWTKTYNTFYHSLRKENRKLAKDTHVPEYVKANDIVQSAQIQIGSKLFPDYPIRSSSEAYYFLKKAHNLNTVFHNHVHSLNINAREYLDHKFVMVFDTEMVNGHVAAFTGRNIKNGEQITLKMDLPTGTEGTARKPEDVHIVLEAEQVLEVRGTYVRAVD